MPIGGLSDHDSADRAQFLKLYIRLQLIAGPLIALAGIGAAKRGWIPLWLSLVLLLLNPAIVYLLARAIYYLIDRTAAGLVTMVYAGGGEPGGPPHSGIESLEARGRYPEAAAAWRSHLLEYPGDNQARFKLADLCRRHLDRPDEAEGVLLEVRRSQPTEADERQASNQLIELFHATGQVDREIVELARFADRWKGTRAGADAARALAALKEKYTS